MLFFLILFPFLASLWPLNFLSFFNLDDWIEQTYPARLFSVGLFIGFRASSPFRGFLRRSRLSPMPVVTQIAQGLCVCACVWGEAAL